LKKGQDLLDAGKYTEAIEPLKQAIKLAAAGEAGPHYTLGVVYRMLNRYDDAIEEFTEALKNDPALTDALLRRGVCWYYKDEFSLAQADFEDASGASTSDPRPLTWKGMTLVKLGQLRDAVNVYSEALRYDNHYAPAHINRGLAYVALKEYGRAVTDFDQAIRSTPKDASLYYKRGIAQGGLGNWQEAVKSYSEAIRINPKYADAYSGRSAAYRRLGDAEKAQADAAKQQELKSTTGRVGQSAAR
jgi:tetratricopeptide (TPR) repeat protein